MVYSKPFFPTPFMWWTIPKFSTNVPGIFWNFSGTWDSKCTWNKTFYLLSTSLSPFDKWCILKLFSNPFYVMDHSKTFHQCAAYIPGDSCNLCKWVYMLNDSLWLTQVLGTHHLISGGGLGSFLKIFCCTNQGLKKKKLSCPTLCIHHPFYQGGYKKLFHQRDEQNNIIAEGETNKKICCDPNSLATPPPPDVKWCIPYRPCQVIHLVSGLHTVEAMKAFTITFIGWEGEG